MSTNPFSLVIIALAFLTLFLPFRYSLYLMLALTPFGAAAAFTLPALGGGTILVANLFLAFFFARMFMLSGPNAVVRAFLPPSPGLWLLALTAYALVSALFFPRVMSGITETMMVIRLPGGVSRVIPQPLHFTASNINQIVYALGGLVGFTAAFAAFSREQACAHLTTAIIITAFVNIALAVLDLATHAAGMPDVMDVVRTANYSMLTGAELGGIKRITGAFPEASAFAGYTIVLFAITASLWLDRMRPAITGPLAAVLFLLLMLTTSGAGYVSSAVLFALFFLHFATRPLFNQAPRRPLSVIALTVAAAAGMAAMLLFLPQATASLEAFVDEAILGKMESESGRVRSIWNATAFQNFIDSAGIGVGVGSARASSYVLVLLSNVGVPGATLFVLFIASLLSSRGRPPLASRESQALLRALRSGLVAGLITAAIVVTTYDLGVLHYILAGAIAAILCRPAFGHDTRLAPLAGRRRAVAAPLPDAVDLSSRLSAGSS